MRWIPPFQAFWFWVGFLLGLAAGLLLRLVRTGLQTLRARLQAWREAQARRKRETIRVHLRNALFYLAQSQHVAGDLFPLEAVLLPPRVLPLSPLPPNEDSEEAEDPRLSPLVLQTLPPGLEEPVWEAWYFWPTLSLEDALRGKASLALIGPLGSGKTTALLTLVLQRLREKAEVFPLYVHVADMPLYHRLEASQEGETAEHPAWFPLAEALAARLGLKDSRDRGMLETWLEQHLQTGRVLLLVDGADELPPWKREALWDWLRGMVQAFPQVRWVVAVGVDGYGDLIRLGFQPVRMVPWNRFWIEAFLRRWSRAWRTYVLPHLPQGTPPPREDYLQAWLRHDHTVVWPLELTLKAWGLWAGDIQGNTLVAAVHAWARRFSKDVLHWEPLARAWMRGEPLPEAAAQGLPETLACPAPGWGIRLRHPILAAYGALYDRDETWWRTFLAQNTPHWELRTAALAFWGTQHQQEAAALAETWMHAQAEPLFLGVWEVAKAYLWANLEAGRENLLKRLGWLLGQGAFPVSIRLMAAWYVWRLLGPKSLAGFQALFRHARPEVRQAAFLAAGLTQHPQFVALFQQVLARPEALPGPLRRAAFLALAAIGTEEAVRTLGEFLVQAPPAIQREAAEALARNLILGRKALEEAANDANLSVRKAAVYGLAQIPASWAKEKLDTLQREDPEWLVRDTATRMLDFLNKPSPWTPQTPLPLTQEAPLRAFAQNQGLTLETAQDAWNILARMLQLGTDRERAYALRRLLFYPHPRWVPIVQKHLTHPFPVGDEAWNTLRHFVWAGLVLQPAHKG